MPIIVVVHFLIAEIAPFQVRYSKFVQTLATKLSRNERRNSQRNRHVIQFNGFHPVPFNVMLPSERIISQEQSRHHPGDSI